MRIHLWGTDFRRSTAEMRRELYFSPEARRDRISRLLSVGFTDLVYLHTCNRVEFYTTARDPFCDTRPQWLTLLRRVGLGEEDFFRGYYLEGKSALRHLTRVACSLESLVIGEPQILGQVKEAVAWTKSVGLPLERSLARSFQFVFETAKLVRSETALGENGVSIATLGMRRAVQAEREHPMMMVAVVGRGATSRIILQWLLKNRPGTGILWVNRSLVKLENFPESATVQRMALSNFLEHPPNFSHLFTATASHLPLFDASFFRRVGTKVLAFDFAEPPDIADCDDEVGSIRVIRLKDLREEAEQNTSKRTHEIDRAQLIIETSLRDHLLRQKETPVLREFSDVEARLRSELDSTWQAIQETLPVESRGPIRRWAEDLLKKNLHHSRVHLKSALRKAAEPAVDLV